MTPLRMSNGRPQQNVAEARNLLRFRQATDCHCSFPSAMGFAHQVAAPTLYTGERTRQYQTPVFVAYNLFSLQADKVTYDAQKRTIEATGNVIAVSESGQPNAPTRWR